MSKVIKNNSQNPIIEIDARFPLQARVGKTFEMPDKEFELLIKERPVIALMLKNKLLEEVKSIKTTEEVITEEQTEEVITEAPVEEVADATFIKSNRKKK